MTRIPPHIAWGAFVVGLLLFSVGTSVGLMFIARAHDARIVPDYYHQAVQYDSLRSAQVAGDRLGWTLALAATDSGVAVELADSTGAPLIGLTGSVQTRRPDDAEAGPAVPLVQTAPGRYRAAVGLDRAGLWEVTVRASQPGGVGFEAVRRLEIGR